MSKKQTRIGKKLTEIRERHRLDRPAKGTPRAVARTVGDGSEPLTSKDMSQEGAGVAGASYTTIRKCEGGDGRVPRLKTILNLYFSGALPAATEKDKVEVALLWLLHHGGADLEEGMVRAMASSVVREQQSRLGDLGKRAAAALDGCDATVREDLVGFLEAVGRNPELAGVATAIAMVHGEQKGE